MKLDLDQYLAAMSPPTLVIGGREYAGTAVLTFHDAVRLQQRLKDDPSGETVLSVAEDACRLVGIDPSVLVGLPGAAITKVVAGFFESGNQGPE